MLSNRPTALLVSRDQKLGESYASVLRTIGYAVDVTEDGRVAFAMALRQRPSAVVLALDSTQLGGLELCELLRYDASTRTLPLVAVVDDVRREREARDAGIKSIIVASCDETGWRSVLSQAAPAATPPAAPVSRPPAKRRRAATNAMERSLTPPQPPPALHCPRCGGPLSYRYSDIGGAERREQWDRFSCGGCGDYQYRPRTRRLSPVTWLER